MRLLAQLMPPGDALPECAVETAEGTRVAHVGWLSEARWAAMNPDDASCTIAPEISVELFSPANTLAEMLGRPDKPGKRELYLRAGASEFWGCDESGRLSCYGSSGQIQESALCPGFPDQV